MAQKLLAGTVHKMPVDLQKALLDDTKTAELWQSLTPLGRNEFICWVEEAKQEKTRERRIRRTTEELHEGRRRPCCWMGCIHRTDKEIAPSIKGILAKRSKTK